MFTFFLVYCKIIIICNQSKGDETVDAKSIKSKLHYLLWYFIIFSVVGLIIETTYGFATMGIIESRKGLYLGPFCPIYGVGGSLLICLLDKFKNSKIKLAIYGGILGSIIEYLLSFMLEAIYGARFWDYGYVKYNLNGRICIVYSIFWAILSVILIGIIKPKIDKYIDKIGKDELPKENTKKFEFIKKKSFIDLGVFIFLITDALITVWAVSTYQNRVINQYYGIEVQNKNSIIKNIEDYYFSNEKMLFTFPNLRIRDKDGNEVFVKNMLNEINNR